MSGPELDIRHMVSHFMINGGLRLLMGRIIASANFKSADTEWSRCLLNPVKGPSMKRAQHHRKRNNMLQILVTSATGDFI
jgi:hypothetical protein